MCWGLFQVDFWFSKIVKPFTKQHPHLMFPTGRDMKSIYMWASAVVSGYSFTLGEDCFLGMVPMWDMLNHVTGKVNVRLHHCEDRGVLQMIATKVLFSFNVFKIN